MINTLLEYTAFGASMLCVYCYGSSKKLGALVGMTTAILFMIWGVSAGIYAASLTNIVFFILHIRNYKRG